ncbi:MAG: LamB/YcsF family protein [Spirochaetes bacterium]|nr:LamB/YcsF family protein [Spirochaetota bacterium]
MYQVDLNSDLGEAYGLYTMGMDKEIIALISSANIGCGWHGGDPVVMDETVKECKGRSVAVGAHPGFPDLMGFGRRNMAVTPAEAKAYAKYQLGALWAFAKSHGVPVQHFKPHGALYNMAATDAKLAAALAQAVHEFDREIIFLGLANSCMITAALECGLAVASEVFADRAYNADGTLVARSQPGAVIHDTELCISRVIRMVKENKVQAITGEDVSLKPDSICVHGDNAKAVEFIKAIREAFSTHGIAVKNLKAM